MRKTKASAGLLSLTLAGGLALAACGGSGDGGGKGGEFTYWSMWRQEEPQAKVIKAAIDRYEKDSGAKVKVVWQGRDIRKKIGPAIAANQAPDLWDNGADVIFSNTVKNGQAADLSSVYDAQVPGEGRKVSDVITAKYTATLPAGPDGGKKWIVPYELVSANLFYDAADPALADASKVATLDDLTRLCDALKAKGKACFTTEGDDGWSSSLWLDYLLAREGGSLGKISADKSGAGWDSPAVLAAARNVEKLVKAGYFLKGYDASKLPAQETNWAQGKAAFFLNGSWVDGETATQRSPKFTFAAINFPAARPGGPAEANAIMFGFSVPKRAKHADAAKKFIADFVKKDNLSGIATEAKNITPRDDIPAPAELADVQKILQKNPSRAMQDNMDGDYGDKVLYPAWLDLLHGKSSPEQFVAAVKKAHETYVKATG
ncbi:ABC transporter substrate-binding protein [Actinomadura gamaensis]|uniref:ABC transporter substrate-binding protein n=1 Tax=Actinomadura gamaensis TaxID=1763541 RepID=A0ABV9U194_9ACTN